MTVVDGDAAPAPAARPLQVGIIGAGNIAANHARGYLAAGARNSWPSPTRRRRRWIAAPPSGAWPMRSPTTGSSSRRPRIDAVSVSTPNAVHGPATMAAAAVGKHVLCEKPVSLSLDEGAAIEFEACRAAAVVLQVNHHLRAQPIGDARQGDARRGRAGTHHVHPLAAGARLGWRPRGPATSGCGPCRWRHVAGQRLSPVRPLTAPGRPGAADVFARAATLKFATEVEDTALATLRFASGALGEESRRSGPRPGGR